MASKENIAPIRTDDGAINSIFSVGADKKVRFSMGNLQYNLAQKKFYFAEHQLDYYGKYSKNKEWIDIYGYGASGYNGCMPEKVGEAVSYYPNQHIEGTNYDWGVFNPVVNGGNKAGLWRTLSFREWYYLLADRPKANKLRTIVEIKGNKALLLLPDDFKPKQVSFPIATNRIAIIDRKAKNDFTLSQLAELEAAGAVLLPGTGFYWTSAQWNDQMALSLELSDWYTLNAFSGSTKSRGGSVRLVQDII